MRCSPPNPERPGIPYVMTNREYGVWLEHRDYIEQLAREAAKLQVRQEMAVGAIVLLGFTALFLFGLWV